MKESTNYICTGSLKALGDYWVIAIIDRLSSGSARFKDLQSSIEAVNTATLSARLKSMHNAGLIQRIEHSRADVEYSLTELGQHAIPVVDAINSFSVHAKKIHENHKKST